MLSLPLGAPRCLPRCHMVFTTGTASFCFQGLGVRLLNTPWWHNTIMKDKPASLLDRALRDGFMPGMSCGGCPVCPMPVKGHMNLLLHIEGLVHPSLLLSRCEATCVMAVAQEEVGRAGKVPMSAASQKSGHSSRRSHDMPTSALPKQAAGRTRSPMCARLWTGTTTGSAWGGPSRRSSPSRPPCSAFPTPCRASNTPTGCTRRRARAAAYQDVPG